MGTFGFGAAAVALLSAALAIVYGPWDAPLPHPATTHRVVALAEGLHPGTPRPLEGALSPNTLLKDKAVHLFKDQVIGSETVVPGPGDAITMIDRWGYVWLADAAAPGPRPSEYRLRAVPQAYLGPGRPLGFKYDGDGNLLICDSLKGLIMLEAETQRVVVLANRVSSAQPQAPGSSISFANDLDIAEDGTVYFTECSDISTALDRHGGGFYDMFYSYVLGLYAGTPSGRLLSYTPSTRVTEVVAEGLWFANGVAVSADGTFVAVAETNCFRVWRVYVSGPKAGTREVLIDGLPGFPDGVSRAPDGNFWVAIVAPRFALIPLLKFKLVRSILPWLPAPPVDHQGLLIKMSPSGEVLASLWDPQGDRVSGTSSVEEHAGRVWMGELGGSGVSYISYIDL